MMKSLKLVNVQRLKSDQFVAKHQRNFFRGVDSGVSKNYQPTTCKCLFTTDIHITRLKRWQTWHNNPSWEQLKFWKLLVWVKKSPLRDLTFFHIFHKWLRIFTHLLYITTYTRSQIFIQLSPTLTKLCHIKHDYPVHMIYSKCPPSAETHAFRHLHKLLIALLIAVCGKSL